MSWDFHLAPRLVQYTAIASISAQGYRGASTKKVPSTYEKGRVCVRASFSGHAFSDTHSDMRSFPLYLNRECWRSSAGRASDL
jgi:hypothetical protein